MIKLGVWEKASVERKFRLTEESIEKSVPQWLKWIRGLLTEHKVFLYHHPNVSYWVRMFGGPEGDVLCTPIRADSEGKEICLWPDCVQQGNRQLCEYISDSWQECQLQALEPDQIEGKRIAKPMTNEMRQQEADQPFVPRYANGNPVAKAIVEFSH